MRFYPRKAPRKKADIIVDKIASGKCDDVAISELKVAVAEIAEPEELQRVSWAVLDIAMNSTNLTAAGYALKSMLLFMPMAEDIENALDNRVLTLVEDKSAVSNKILIEGISGYARERVAGDIDRSAVFIPAMLLFLEEASGTTASISYEVLMKAAGYRPEFFEPYAALLTRELGSINNSTRVYAARIITKLARTHPEYMAEAEKTLLHISTFYPDAEVKSAAAEAYQAITQNRAPPQEPDNTPQQKFDSTGGLADIMRKKASVREKSQNGDSRIDNRLLSLAANFARKSDMRNGKAQDNGTPKGRAGSHDHDDSEAMDKIIDDFSEIAGVITGSADSDREEKPAEEKISKEEAELRDMVAKVKMDFSESAESLLDSLGMKHLHKDQQGELQDGETGPVDQEAAAEPMTHQHIPEVEIAAADVEVPGATGAMSEMAENTTAVAEENTDHNEIANATIEIADEPDSSVPVSSKPEMPLEPAVAELSAPVEEMTAEAPAAEVVPEKAAEAPELPAQSSTADSPDVQEKAPVFTPRAIKSPIIPEGVRISAVKFRTLDQNKKQQQPQAKVSIKPHIKPLNRTPRDISKMVQQRPQAAAAAQQTENQTVKADAVQASVADSQQNVENVAAEPTQCPSCGEKITGDQQYCLKCGTDLKSLKVRCPRCSQINAKDTGTCVRCGARLVKGPAAAKQPDIL
ncbi:double zinc ribbon domain-containing protein [Methanocella sp. MCL-LM]|uniref:zinc ribbon domain-containing protein n=1 Tax=Methanocella sp. MCL-LM TaxID=3412035 RepID=UPI003C79521F